MLRPDPDGTMQRLYWYFTAVVALQLGIQVHAVQVLSNHIHEVLTDTGGNLPKFFELRNRLLANAVKCHRGWPEEVFSRTAMSYVELLTVRAIVQKIAYVISNCVAAFLVRSPRDWPGAKVLVDDLGRRVVRVRRPDIYIDSKNPQWPEFVELAHLAAAPAAGRVWRPGNGLRRATESGRRPTARGARNCPTRGPRVSKPRARHASESDLSLRWLGRLGARFPLFSAAGDVAAAAIGSLAAARS